MLTICLVHFKSVTLQQFAAALFSVRQQNLTGVKEIVIVDNDTPDTEEQLKKVVDDLSFPITVQTLLCKHGEPKRTHAWSTNMAMSAVSTPWALMTRSDYLLSFNTVTRVMETISHYLWRGFVTGRTYHLGVDLATCEQTSWRTDLRVLRNLPGAEIDYTCIDAGVWAMRRSDFDTVGGLDESLSAWGHAQTEFQYRLHKSGVECKCLPDVLFCHPQHVAQRDLTLAHQQLAARGVDLHDLWDRYQGTKPYGRRP